MMKNKEFWQTATVADVAEILESGTDIENSRRRRKNVSALGRRMQQAGSDFVVDGQGRKPRR